MQLNELRKELRFNTELVQLIETLKNVAASQYHAMEKEKDRFNAFMDAFAGFFRVVDLAKVDNPLIGIQSDRIGIVMVTSDSGFMGGLNRGVMDSGLDVQRGHSTENTQLVMIGEKGAAMLHDQRREFKFFGGISQSTIYEQAIEVRDYIVAEVLAGRLGKVVVSYPKPISFTSQTIDVVGILPCGELFDREVVDSAIARHTRTDRLVADATSVIVESMAADIVEHLASVWVTSKLMEIFEDSKLAEYSARAMHLEGSFQRLQDEQKKLKLRTFKAIHEKIDRGMRDSFSALSTRRRQPGASANRPDR